MFLFLKHTIDGHILSVCHRRSASWKFDSVQCARTRQTRAAGACVRLLCCCGMFVCARLHVCACILACLSVCVVVVCMLGLVDSLQHTRTRQTRTAASVVCLCSFACLRTCLYACVLVHMFLRLCMLRWESSILWQHCSWVPLKCPYYVVFWLTQYFKRSYRLLGRPQGNYYFYFFVFFTTLSLQILCNFDQLIIYY